MKEKQFHLRKDQVVDLAMDYGACFATDEIMVKGRPVGYMYREAPDKDIDSGWRFMAGDESQDYMDNPGNIGIYDVNTIANYDRKIIELLDAPVGSSFIRHPGSETLLPISDESRIYLLQRLNHSKKPWWKLW